MTERERERASERQNASGGGPERERDAESAAGSRLSAARTEPQAGLNPRDRDLSRSRMLNRLGHPGHPILKDLCTHPAHNNSSGPTGAKVIVPFRR